jgi:hypothetical protein
MISTSDPFLRMRGASGYRDWAAGVRAIAGEPEVVCIREALEGLASNTLENFDPLNRFTEAHGESFPMSELWHAAERVEQSIPQNAYSALVAATVIVNVWLVNAAKNLYGQEGGMPEPGWGLFPYVWAKASLKTGAIDEGLRVLERSLDVLNAAKYRDHPRLRAALERYRELGVALEARWQLAIANLAGDLHDACRAPQPNFRAEMGALLWTLGMIPESSLLLPGAFAARVPPLRLCRLVTQVSLAGMARDPLTQYIWLEMKDREPFNLREHTVFFGLLNLRYTTSLLDETMPEPPSRVFAKTIIAWFRGDLSEELAGNFIEAYKLIEASFPHSVEWPVYFRMRLLAWMAGERFGWIKDATPASDLEMARELARQAASLNRSSTVHPEWPELYTRASGPVFAMMDRLGAASAPAHEFVSALEDFRAASLGYWLTAAPPMAAPAEQEAAAALIEEEQRLLADLKGAYFMILAPVLPMHYRRSARPFGDDPASAQSPDMSKGLGHYKRLLDELAGLHTRMEAVAPEYAKRRKNAVADVTGLAQALGAHRGG